MLKASRLALLYCLTLLPAFQNAAAEDLKIGYVNLERIFREAPAAISASKKMQEDSEGRRNELFRLEEDIKSRQAALTANGNSLSESQRRTRETELSEMTINLQRRQQAFLEDLKVRQNDETSALLEKANVAIAELAKTENWDLILQDAVAVSNRIDVTDKVIKKMTGE